MDVHSRLREATSTFRLVTWCRLDCSNFTQSLDLQYGIRSLVFAKNREIARSMYSKMAHVKSLKRVLGFLLYLSCNPWDPRSNDWQKITSKENLHESPSIEI